MKTDTSEQMRTPNPSTPEATRPVAEVLRRVLQAFGPNGEFWAQGTPKACAEPYCCVNTAFWRIGKVDYPLLDKAWVCFLDAGGFHEGGSSRQWNDAPERTFTEIKALFEKAIAKAEAQ